MNFIGEYQDYNSPEFEPTGLDAPEWFIAKWREEHGCVDDWQELQASFEDWTANTLDGHRYIRNEFFNYDDLGLY